MLLLHAVVIVVFCPNPPSSLDAIFGKYLHLFPLRFSVWLCLVGGSLASPFCFIKHLLHTHLLLMGLNDSIDNTFPKCLSFSNLQGLIQSIFFLENKLLLGVICIANFKFLQVHDLNACVFLPFTNPCIHWNVMYSLNNYWAIGGHYYSLILLITHHS